jgi:hypothetical protein
MSVASIQATIVDSRSRHICGSALRIAPRRDASRVDVLNKAAERGFELEERPLRGQSVWG